MTAAARGGAAVLAAIALAACAAPSRRLTPRVVEDPIVLPSRLASALLTGLVAHYEPTDARRSRAMLGFRYGITDRLEWVDLLSLRYALLDDRPADGRPARPVSLAVRGGVVGIGYGSISGFIIMPVASIDALKHVADRWTLSLSLSWEAIWMARGGAASPSYWSNLGYATNAASNWTLRGAVTRQLSERVALGASLWGGQEIGCLDPTCAWSLRGAGGGLTVSVRPWHWLTVAAGPLAGIRYRPAGPSPVPVPPTAPVVVPLRRVEWVGLTGTATFYW